VAFLSIAGTWGATTAFTSRDTHAMGADAAMQALATPIADDDRKLAVAALRRQVFAIVTILRAESSRPGELGDEARAALAHISKEACK
jgi:hypothetical protein